MCNSDTLAKKYAAEHRYANFGECMNSMDICQIKGMTCSIEFNYPVTAITGLNGSGKTTVVQLLLCAYNNHSKDRSRPHRMDDFFHASALDSDIFGNDANVTYLYQSEDQDKDKVIKLTKANGRWIGDQVLPKRRAFYISPRFYLPTHGFFALMLKRRGEVVSETRHEIDEKRWISKILGNTYCDVFFHESKNKLEMGSGIFRHRQTQMGVAERYSKRYSESNMGFGEARVIQLVRLLENCPDKSLIVFDEPDIGLHVSAQRELTRYFISVSIRKGHQIVFSTHSPEMVDELPSQGRKMIGRSERGVEILSNVSSMQVNHALSHGQNGFLVIFVEDKFAKMFVEEILTTRKVNLSRRFRVIYLKGDSSVRAAVRYFGETEYPAIGVLDADENEILDEKIFTLPGEKLAPEKVVYFSESVKKLLQNKYGFDFDRYMAIQPNADHHGYSSYIERETGVEKKLIDYECIKEFVNSQPKNWGDDLVNRILENA